MGGSLAAGFEPSVLSFLSQAKPGPMNPTRAASAMALADARDARDGCVGLAMDVLDSRAA